MQRLPWILVALMFLMASFSGCFGGDGGDSDDGDDNDTPPVGNGDNNTTQPPPVAGGNNTSNKTLKAPIPGYKVTMKVFDDDQNELDSQEGTTFVALSGSNVTFTFDATPSTDPDGEVVASSWIVEGPSGEFKAAAPILSFSYPRISGADFGIYKATVKALDNDNVLNSTTFFVTVNYKFEFVRQGMHGAGQASCGAEDENPGEAGAPVPLPPAAPQVVPGTWKVEEVPVNGNVSAVNITLAYVAPTGSTMAVRLLLPSTPKADATCPDIGMASGATPLSLPVTEGLTEVGRYKVRADLAGARVESYTLTVEVFYTPPAEAPAEPTEG